ncbi:MAG: hypothetical protein PHO37_17085 [Kiritimatiellae bacterium]|nr:hypothetical protein [Kiritimatiellia bacterium]
MAKQKKEKKAAAQKPAKINGTELVIMESEDKDILSGISNDLDNADIGAFYRARACVALVLLKERCPHGLYESTTAEAMPNRSPRSLRRYYSEGKAFLSSANLKAADAYAQLRGFDPVNALAQAGDGRLLIGTGEESGEDAVPVPAAVEALANKINEKIEEKAVESGRKEKPKLTKVQKRDAATADLTLAISKVNVALNSDWTLIDTETLDTIAASLTVAAATIKEEIKKRG